MVPFPVEAASPAITSVVNLLLAAGAASILLGPDKSVKYVSDEAKALFEGAPDMTLRTIESLAGIRVGDLSTTVSKGVRIGNRNIFYSLVPLSGGAGGAAMVFRPVDPLNERDASILGYVRETILEPLRSLRESLQAASSGRGGDPLLTDTASTIDQVLGSLEMSPQSEVQQATRPAPTVTEVVSRVAERFTPFAGLKGVQLQVDAQELAERFRDHEQLADALGVLMDNALHYVPAGGQVVAGVRWMEHKGKPLLLFFVMDNGPVVPESLRQAIFEPSFVWNAASPERTGRGLFKCREFALAHHGAVWAESKTGKACTFFLRIRPDGVE